MRLSPARFNGMLGDMGQQVLWRQATVCPCRDPHSGAARPGCPICLSKGQFWGTATSAWTGVAGQKVMREWAAYGMWESGDQVLTIPSDSPLYACGEFDRVVMSNSSEPFSVVLLPTGNGKVAFPVAEIDRVCWLSPDRTIIVDGDIPTVASDGTLTWVAGASAPPAGVQFTVTGRKRPEYFIFRDMPQDRAHFGGLALPRRVVARRFDLMGK